MRGRSIGKEIQAIRRSFAVVARVLERMGNALQSNSRQPVLSSGQRRRLRLSPARRASLKLQGQYMGYMRNLRPKQKNRVKALREARGVRAAITLAKSLALAGSR